MIKTDFKVIYVTNIWNHYQSPICSELVRLMGKDCFKLCLFEPVDDERRKLGWEPYIPDHKWIVGPPNSKSDLYKFIQIICDADVAIMGNCPREVQVARAATGKLTFIMNERLWKQPFTWWRMLNPRYARGVRGYKQIANRPNVHYLPIGAYAARDVRQIGAYGDRVWNWAYFTEVSPQPPQSRFGNKIHILWVGRMLKWKRVDLLLKATANVCHEAAFGQLDVVGTGPENLRLKKLAQKLKLGDKCVFHDPVTPGRVRELMRKADVYALPSNRNEGWGVVANEAMSEGAVLVANEQSGAAPMLIDHGRTGFLFRDGDVAHLTSVLQTIMCDIQLRETVRQSAWREIQLLWHPRVGAERLIRLIHGLLGLDSMPQYRSGPAAKPETASL